MGVTRQLLIIRVYVYCTVPSGVPWNCAVCIRESFPAAKTSVVASLVLDKTSKNKPLK